ncbi:calcium-activated chloride channel-domain-containing protein [Syncephalis fuscata]|nr:calcium-activated chloride channel-domain-containing protein [Syncephalis fuscata]
MESLPATDKPDESPPVQQIRRATSEVVVASRPVETDVVKPETKDDDAHSEVDRNEVASAASVRRYSMTSERGLKERPGKLANMDGYHTRAVDDRQIQLWYWEDVQLFDLVERFRRQQENSELLTPNAARSIRDNISRNSDAISVASSISSCDIDKKQTAIHFEEAMNKFGSNTRGDAIVKLVYGVRRYDFILKFPDHNLDENQNIMRKAYEKELLRRGIYLEHEAWPDDNAVYVKCLGGFDVLAREAERIRLRLPLTNDMTIPPPMPEGRFSFFRRLWWAMFSHSLRERDSDMFRVDRLHEFLSIHKPRDILNGGNRPSMVQNFEDDEALRDKVPVKKGGERDIMVKDASDHSDSDSDDSDDDNDKVPHLVLGVDDMGPPDASQTATEAANDAIKEKENGQIPLWLLKERLMTSGLRSLLIHSIITTTIAHPHGIRVSLNYLLAQSIYTASFPPHDGGLTDNAKSDSMFPTPMATPAASALSLQLADTEGVATDLDIVGASAAIAATGDADPASVTNLRAYLYKNGHPIELVRAYFGEKIALYFVWVGFYTVWLTVPTIIGIVFFIYGIISFVTNKEYEGGIQVNKLRGLVDNPTTLPWALIISLWAVLFLEFWKRKHSCIAYEWHISDYEREERTRPNFRPTAIRTSPITGKLELYVPPRERKMPVIASVSVRGPLADAIRKELDGKVASLVPSVIGAVINLIIIIVLGQLYNIVCHWLNDQENHRTFTQFNDSQIIKRYLFDFFNFYSILFFYGVINVRNIDNFCGPDNTDKKKCQPLPLTDLMIQMVIIFVGRQAIGQVQEIAIPYLKNKWLQRKELAERIMEHHTHKKISKPRYVKDDKLPEYDVDEYNEMVVQFGFLSLFSVAFPLAPLCALINNVVEIRSDAFKLLTIYQRPLALRAQDIGMWSKILSVLALIAVPVNALIVALSSQWVHENIILAWAKQWFSLESDSFIKITEVKQNGSIWGARLAFVLIFEHLVLLVHLAVIWLVPSKPEAVTVAKERERYRRAIKVDPQLMAEDASMDDLEEVHQLRRRRRQHGNNSCFYVF